MNWFDEIGQALGEAECLAQLAEAGAALTDASLKLRRALDGGNHPRRSVEECRKAYWEAWADIELCLRVMPEWTEEDVKRIVSLRNEKMWRWYRHLGLGARGTKRASRRDSVLRRAKDEGDMGC